MTTPDLDHLLHDAIEALDAVRVIGAKVDEEGCRYTVEDWQRQYGAVLARLRAFVDAVPALNYHAL